jgi:methyltransferase family protein
MIYRSNLTCPDLTPHFKHLISRPMPHSFGHDVPSDWGDKADDDPVFGIYKRCGMWTHDEAAILYSVARSVGGRWFDVGSHTGWTSAHLRVAGVRMVAMVDPLYTTGYRGGRFGQRTFDNMATMGATWYLCDETSLAFFARVEEHDHADGVCIDGDHEPGKPLEDATNAAKHLAEPGVIIFHDFIGRPVREAVEYLMAQGFHCRVYKTPHMVACCWRGDFVPPDHVPDPNLPDLFARCPDFDFTRCL